MTLDSRRRGRLGHVTDASYRLVGEPLARLCGDHRQRCLLPYLLQHSSEIPGLLQQLYDERRRGTGAGPGARVILCGSAVSVMHELLSGTKPLRGRAVIDLRLGAFDYRAGRVFWQIDDPLTALRVPAVLGGAPGYRPVAARPHPDDGFASWLTRTLLDPGRAVYSRTETEYLLRKDPRITRHTLSYDVLESTGCIQREQDILRPRHPVITLADPVIRFNQLITLPQDGHHRTSFRRRGVAGRRAGLQLQDPRPPASRTSPAPPPTGTLTPCFPAAGPVRSLPPAPAGKAAYVRSAAGPSPGRPYAVNPAAVGQAKGGGSPYSRLRPPL